MREGGGGGFALALGFFEEKWGGEGLCLFLITTAPGKNEQWSVILIHISLLLLPGPRIPLVVKIMKTILVNAFAFN